MSHPPLGADIESLCLRAKKGDREAIRLLIEQTQNQVFRFCFQLTGDSSSAEDLAQETFLKAFSRFGDLDQPSGLISWLIRIAHNTYRDAFKTAESKLKSRTISDDPDAERTGILARQPSQESGTPEQLEATLDLQRTLQLLKEDERAVLLLIDHEGYSYDEAAALLKTTEPAVRNRVSRARKAFLAAFERNQPKKSLSQSRKAPT